MTPERQRQTYRLEDVMNNLPPVLDACCGGKLFWFNRNDPRAIFMDVREGVFAKDLGTPQTTGRAPIVVSPDVIADFTSIPFPDESFSLVVFDPPHHTEARMGTGMRLIRASYGVLFPGWEEMLQQGFKECFRVLRPTGVLVFKWGSKEIPLSRILKLTTQKPLFGHRTTQKGTTHWVLFIKP